MGPYYSGGEVRIAYYPDGEVAGFLDPFDPAGRITTSTSVDPAGYELVGRILYYRREKDASGEDVFVETDNETDGNAKSGFKPGDLQNLIDEGFIHTEGREYLLISPGPDRCYGSGRDITN